MADTKISALTALDSTADLGQLYIPLFKADGSPDNARILLYEALKSGVFATIQSLKNLPGSINGQIVGTSGYYLTGDCEPLFYKWDPASTATDDGVDSTHPGLVIQPTAVAGAGRWVAVGIERVNARWYGASPSEADNKPYLQRAVREIIHQPWPKHLFIPAGSYTCASGILCKKDSNADGNPESFSLMIEGEAGMPYGLAGMTKLNFTHVDTFGIGIQLGKGIRIKSIELDGMNNCSFADPRAAFTSAESGYVINGCRDDRYSPYAGIAIDPFGPSSVSAGNRYPTYSAEYVSGHTGGGSTEIQVGDCKITGFVTNVVISPNGVTQNAEQIEFKRVWNEQCKVAFAVGQLQSRSVHINDCTSWGNVLWWINCSDYGAGGGQLPHVHGGNIAGHLKYLIKCTGSPVVQSVIQSLYAESLYALGTVAVDLLTFRDCFFQWSLPDASIAAAHCILRNTKKVVFDGCFLIHSSNPPASKQLRFFNSGQLNFQNCTLDVPPVSHDGYEDQISHINSRFRHINAGRTTRPGFSTGGMYIASPYSNANGAPVQLGMSVQRTGLASESAKRYIIGGDTTNGAGESVAVTVTGNGRATFTASNAAIWSTARNSASVVLYANVVDEFGSNGYPTGYVESVSGSTVTLAGLPDQFTSRTCYVSLLFPYRWHEECTGSTTSGSNVITEVLCVSNVNTVWVGGDSISGAGIPPGTFVTATDNAAKTITLSQNCTATATRVDLYDAIQYSVSKSAAVPSVASSAWRKGDVIDDTTGATNGWRCTVSGVIGSGTEPTFVAR